MKRIIFIGFALYCIAFVALIFGQNFLIYPFDPTHRKPAPRITEHRVKTNDGETLVLWAAKPKRRQPTILYFHGNAGNLHNRSQRFDRMLDRGYGLVALGYRGSSGSTGKPSQRTLGQDSQLILSQLENLIGEPNNLVFYGESLGTAVAIQLAANAQPDALILEAPFTSMRELVAQSLPMFPTRLGLRDHWDSLDQMPNLSMPLLVMHGTTDTVVPFPHGQRIFDAAGSPNKTFHKVKGLGHTGHWSVAGQKAIYRFIDGL